MRKHLLLGASVALVLAAPAFANESDVSQSGSSQTWFCLRNAVLVALASIRF